MSKLHLLQLRRRARSTRGRRTLWPWLALFIALLIIASPAAQPGTALAQNPSPENSQSGLAPVNDDGSSAQLIVKFKASTSSADMDNIVRGVGGQSKRKLIQIRTHVISVPANARDQLLAAYARHPQVERATGTITLRKAGDPNDPNYVQQWALPRIAWDQAYGSIAIAGSATLAVLDTGVDAAHPDLAGRLVASQSFVGGDAATDPNGHGTALAGIAAANTNNGAGIAGVAYAGANLSSVQVLQSDGTGLDADVVAGVLWAADNGANVILMGFSSPDYSPALADALAYAWGKGVTLVAATGNDGSSAPTYPAGMPNVLGVASSDQSDLVSANSNMGSALIGAPGVGIYTTLTGGGYGEVSGTSAASAHVAGLAALLAANGKSNSYIFNQVRGTSDSLSGQTFGRINVFNALGAPAAPQPTQTPAPTPTPGPTPTYTPGAVTVTPATFGTNISADQAANATSPLYTTLGNIVITEGAANNNDFATGTNVTLILTAPSGWSFNAGVGNVSAQNGRNITNESISVSSTTITITLTVNATDKSDTVTISGIQVRANDGANLSNNGSILRTSGNPGTATIAGITNNSTNFGSLSQAAGAMSKLLVTLPGQTFTDGTTVASSGISGTPNNQTAGTSFTISSLTATDQFFNVVTSYSGAKTISYSGPGSNSGFPAPSYTTAVTFASGQSTTTLTTTLRKAETTNITANDGTITGPASSSLTVVTGALNSFKVTNTSDGNIGTQTAGTAFDIRIRAVDVGGNTVTSFTGASDKVDLTPSSGALSAGGGNTAAFTNGVLSSHSVTFSTVGTYPGTFSLTATGIGGNSGISGTSNSFTVNGPPCTTPVVSPQPTNQTVTYNANATFTSGATGTPAPTVQWQVSTNGGSTWTNIGGATNTTLTLTAPTVSMSGNLYRAAFTNTCGTVNSNFASLTVNPKALTVTGITASNKVYDGTITATLNTSGAALVGVVGGDSVTLNTTSATGTFADKNVGTNKSVQVSGLSLSGADAGNYTLTQPTTTANITPKALTVTGITASNKVYDGTITATLSTSSAVLNGVVSPDVVSLNTSGATGAFADKNVGTPKTVTISGLTIGGAGAGNYTLTQPTATASITQRALTVSATGINKVYDGTSSATVTLSDNRVGGDLLTINYSSASFVDKNEGTGKTVNVSGISVTGTDAGNYTFNTSAITTANITQRALTVNAAGINKVYDGTTAASVTLSDNRVAGDVFTATFTSATFSTRNVGTAIVINVSGISLSGTDAGNYSVNSSAATSANITARPITVTAVSDSKPYDSTTSSTGTPIISGTLGSGDTGNFMQAFQTKSVGTSKTIVPSGSVNDGNSGNNYAATFVNNATGVITAKTLTVTGITANNKVYDGSTGATLNLSSAALVGVVGGDNVTLDTTSVSAAFADKNVGNDKTVTISGLSLSGTDAGNYTLTQPTASATITAKVLTVSGVAANDKVYDGGTSASLNTSGAALVGVVGGDTVTLNTASATGTFADKNVGSGKTVTISGFTISGADAANYTLTQPTTTANITPKSLTVTGITASNKIYDGGTSATLNTSGAALVGVISPDVVNLIVSGATGAFADKNVGTNKSVQVSGLTLSGADAGNYSATQPTTTANITSKPLTVTGITANNKVYDGGTSATLNTGSAALAGVVLTDTVTLDTSGASGSFADKTVGTNKTVTITGLTITGADATNYSLTQPTATASITQRPLNVTATGGGKTYDGTTNATVTLSTDKLNGDDVTPAYTTATFITRNVGIAITINVSGISISGADAPNYSLQNTTANTNANIAARPITVTAVSDTRIYNGTTSSAGTPNVSGGLGTGDSANFTQTFDDKNVGTGKTLTPAGSVNDGNGGNNYSVTFANNINGEITKRDLTVSASGQNKQYDGTAAAFVLLSHNGLGGDTLYVAYTSASFADKHVGTSKQVTVSSITLSGADSGNYSFNTIAYTSADITARPLTVTAVSDSKVYDGTTSSTATPTISGTIATGDMANFTQAFASKTVGTGKTLVPSGSVNDGSSGNNYSVTFVNDTSGVISAKGLTVTGITANSKIYNGSTSATLNLGSAALVGVVSSDNVTLDTTNVSAAFADKNIGTSKTVTISGLSLSGADAGNYALTQPSASANITQRGLTVSATAQNKIYDGTNNASVTLSDDRVLGDALNVTFTSASFVDKNVANGKTVNVTGISVTDADAGNYTFNTSTSTTANVTPRGLTISAQPDQKVYDGTTSSAGTPTTSGLQSGDSVSGLVQTFDTRNVGTGKTLTVVSYLVSDGNGGNNYSVTRQTSSAGVITARGLTITAQSNSKLYDATTSAAAVPSVSGLQLGDSVTGLSETYDNKNVGTSKTLLVAASYTINDGNSGNNYSVTLQSDNTGVITQANLVGSITASDKVYDATVAATIATRTLTGVLNTDVVSYTGGTATFDNKNVGSGKIVTATNLSLTGADAGNYNVNSTAVTTASITTLAITGSITASNKVYDATDVATIVTRTLTGVLNSDVVSYTGGSATFDNKNVGNGKTVTGTGLSLTGTDAGNYSVNSTAQTTASITQRPLNVSATGVDKTYDGTTNATVTLSSDKLNGDDVTPAYTTATFITRNVGIAITINVSGISITGTDAPNYSLQNTAANTSANISKRPITVTAVSDTKVYDGGLSSTGTPTITGGLGAGDTANFAQTFDNKNVGTAKTLIPSGSVNDGNSGNNYSVTFANNISGEITKRDLTVSATGIDKVYDGTTSAGVTLSSDKLNGDNVTPAYTSVTFITRNVGIAIAINVSGISIGGADATNYNLQNTSANTSANITARPITVTAVSNSKIYDGTTSSTGTPNVSGELGTGDTPNFSQTFDTKNVGTGKTLTPAGSVNDGNSGNNYSVTFANNTSGEITQRDLTVGATGMDKVYDATTNAQVTLSTNKLNGDAVTPAYTSANFNNKNVGTFKSISVSGISISGTDAGNYNLLSTSANTSANITSRALSVSATGIDKVYDGTITATVTLSSTKLNGDVVTLSYTSASFNNKNVGTTKPISVSGIGIGGDDAPNYNLQNNSANTSASITQQPITGSITADNKIYDATDAASIATRTLTGVLGLDDVSYTGGTATFNNKNVGIGKIVTGINLSLSGADAGNYSVNSTALTTANISARPITGSITADNKVYDGNVTATIATRTLLGVLNSDVVSYIGGTATFVDQNVGTGKAVNATGLSLSGADAANYSVNDTAATTASITARPITVKADAQSKIYGSIDPSLTFTVTLGSLVTNDGFSGALSRVSGENVAQYTILQNTLTAGSNYTLTYQSDKLTINPATLTVKANDKVKTYGDPNPSFDATISGFVFSETESGLRAASALSGNPVCSTTVATSASSPVSGSPYTLACTQGTLAATNYIFSFATGTLKVEKAPLSVTANDQSRVYGQNNPTLNDTNVSFNGFVNSENKSALGGTLAFAFINGGSPVTSLSPVGEYKIRPSGYTSGNYTLSFVDGKLTVNKANSATSASNQNATFGQSSVTLTANVGAVAPSTAAVSEGTVQFVVKQGASTLATISGSVSNGAASANLPLGASFVVGNYSINATYLPATSAPNFNGSAATAASLSISSAASALALNPITAVQYSDRATLVANVAPASLNGQNQAGTVEFFVDNVSVGSAPVSSGAATLTPALLQSPGNHNVTATFTSSNANFANAATASPTTVAVTVEDADTTFTGNNVFWGATTSASSAMVTLAATVRDITAYSPSADPDAGDIRNARVSFEIRDVNNSIVSAPACTNLTPSLLNASDSKVGRVTCDASLNISNSSGSQYTIKLLVNGHYRCSGDGCDTDVVTVAQPLTSNFITGGGYLQMSSSAGQYAADTGTKNNFGFNVKYNKNGTNLQGNVNIILRKGGKVYQIKANALTSMGVSQGTSGSCPQATATNPCKANFISKANLQDITNPSAPISLGGNLTLQLQLTDTGDPGTKDSIAITLYDGSTLLFSSNWDGSKTAEKILNGGSLVVH